MANIVFDGKIQALSSNNYDHRVVEGRLYYFEVFYASGATGTITAKQLSPDGVTYQDATLPTDPTAAMAITATGVARGFDLRATSKVIRLAAGTISGDVRLVIGEVAHGRS